jgi:hypothetical protein
MPQFVASVSMAQISARFVYDIMLSTKLNNLLLNAFPKPPRHITRPGLVPHEWD